MKLRLRGVLAVFCLFGFFVSPPFVFAGGSVLLSDPFLAGNGGMLMGSAAAGYISSGGTLAITNPTIGNLQSSIITPDTVYSFFLPATATQSPESGEVKDSATFTVNAAYSVGNMSIGDGFDVSISGSASAVNSMVSGAEAGAFISGYASAYLRFEDIGMPGSLLGLLELDVLRGLVTYETLAQWTVTDYTIGSVDEPVVTVASLDHAFLYSLYEGHAYELRFDYEAVVPFGDDPPFSIDAHATLTIPEPSTGVFMALGALILGKTIRRQRKQKCQHNRPIRVQFGRQKVFSIRC